jgi:hypothetical protein
MANLDPQMPVFQILIHSFTIKQVCRLDREGGNKAENGVETEIPFSLFFHSLFLPNIFSLSVFLPVLNTFV